MQLSTASDLGHLIKDARRFQGWSQNALAAKVGVSRQWISSVENGKATVEFDLALRTLNVLGYQLRVEMGAGRNQSRNADSTLSAISPPQTHRPSGRMPLTRKGRTLNQNPRRS